MIKVITEKLTDGSFIAKCSDKYGMVVYGEDEIEVRQIMKNKISFRELKEKLSLSNEDLAMFFNMSYGAYANSTAKDRYENALLRFYNHVMLGGKKEN